MLFPFIQDYSESEFTDEIFNEAPDVETVEAPGEADESPIDETAPGEEVTVEGDVEVPTEPTLAEMAALTAGAASKTAYEAAKMAEILQDQVTPENADVLDDAISMASEAADIAKQAAELAEEAADSEPRADVEMVSYMTYKTCMYRMN